MSLSQSQLRLVEREGEPLLPLNRVPSLLYSKYPPFGPSMLQLVHSIVPTGRAEVVVGESSVTKPNELLSERRWWGKHLLPV